MENKKFRNAVIIAGMKFDPINACAHRMSSIAKIFKSYCDNVILFGVGKSKSEGFFDSLLYYTFQYPNSLFSWIKYSISARKIKKNLRKIENLDLVIVNGSIPSIPTNKIAKYCKRKNIKFVFDIDEWNHKSTDGFPRCFVKNLDTWLKMHILCKKFKNYIVSSSYLFNHCNSKGKNIFIMPALVTKKENIVLQKKLNKDLILSFVGLIEKHGAKENLCELITAINEFNITSQIQIYLNIVGVDGVSTKYIKYYGVLDYKECVSTVANSNFTVIPRFKNRKNQAGFPTKLSESFLYGVPVIATDTSDISLYLINGKNGYLLKDNSKDQFIKCFKDIEKNMINNKNYFVDLRNSTIKLNQLTLEHFAQNFNVFVKNI